MTPVADLMDEIFELGLQQVTEVNCAKCGGSTKNGVIMNLGFFSLDEIPEVEHSSTFRFCYHCGNKLFTIGVKND